MQVKQMIGNIKYSTQPPLNEIEDRKTIEKINENKAYFCNNQ